MTDHTTFLFTVGDGRYMGDRWVFKLGYLRRLKNKTTTKVWEEYKETKKIVW